MPLSSLYIISCLAVLSTADTSVAPYAEWGQQTLELIEQDFATGRPGAYFENQDKTEAAFAWSNSVLFFALTEAAAYDPHQYKPRLQALIRRLDDYWTVYHNIGGYNCSPIHGGKADRYYDDNAWIAMGLVDAYKATGEPNYIQKAKQTVTFSLSGKDQLPSNGIWWRESWPEGSGKSKNTCSVAPTAFACLRLYEVTRDKQYLDTAGQLMAWLDKTLKDSDGLYWDNINLNNRIDRRKYTYNSAMPMRCYILRYRLEKDPNDLQAALLIADAAEKRWIHSETGAMRGPSMFGFTLAEGWLELSAAAGQTHWKQLTQKAIDYVYHHTRDSKGRYAGQWDAEVTRPLKNWNLMHPSSAARLYWKLAMQNRPQADASSTATARP